MENALNDATPLGDSTSATASVPSAESASTGNSTPPEDSTTATDSIPIANTAPTEVPTLTEDPVQTGDSTPPEVSAPVAAAVTASSATDSVPSAEPAPTPPKTAGWASVDEVPAQHFALFLPWIHLGLPKEVISENAEELGLSNEQKEVLLAANTIKDNDEHIQDVYRTYFELFKDVRIARNIAKWFQAKADPEAFEVYKNEILNHPTHDNINFKVSSNLPIVEIVKALEEHVSDPVYKNIAAEVKDMYKKGGILHFWAARCIFFIKFIMIRPERRRPKDWLLEFLTACSYHPKTRPFASFINPGYKDKLEEYRVSLYTQNTVPSQFTADIVLDEKPPTSPRPSEFFGKKPARVTGEITANSYILYPYQVELTGPAKNNKNTIICAPTGSGKTLVAVDIIADHLRMKRSCRKIGRTVVFVPTVPLVEQQKEYIEGKIGTEFYVTKMSGNERVKSGNERLVDILIGDIIVMTPQIFINMLQSPLKSQRIYLTDFTLMIFDECHHCAERHPYNVVMDYVRNATIKPQIVGLTASTGSGKSNTGRVNHENTIEHIIGLCARLTAVTVSSVKDKTNLEDLMSRISQPVDDFVSVPHPNVDKFAHEIALICDHIEKAIHSDLKELTRLIPNLSEDHIQLAKEDANDRYRNGQAKTGIGYYSKMVYIKTEVKRATQMSNVRLFILRALELLDMLYYTLKYNELFPASLAIKYLNDRFEEYEEKYMDKENSMDSEKSKQLRDIYDYVKRHVQDATRFMGDSENKPILENLMQILQDQHKQEPSSRVIIFVEMRRVGADLAAYLSQREEITSSFGPKKVGYIASTNQASSRFGQNANDQQWMLDRFKDATLQILVATSVAEEGLDVAACNLIVKYNSVGSEKSLTQRKGRARARNSRAVLLALDEKTMSREFDNVRKEYMMNICIRHLQTMSEIELQRRIRERYEEMKETAKIAKQREEETKNLRNNQIYTLHCICGLQFCTSEELFSLNNNEVICCNPDCWKDTKIEKKIEKVKGGSVAVRCGAWSCRCGHQRGGVFKYGGVFLPSISSNAFTLKTVSGETDDSLNIKAKSWEQLKERLFSISLINSNQIRVMAASLYEYSQALFKQAEENEKLNILESLKEDKKKYQFRARYALND